MNNEEKGKGPGLWLSIASIVLNLLVLAIYGFHLSKDTLASYLLLPCSIFWLKAALKTAPSEAAENSPPQRGPLRAESLFFSHALLIPAFLWFICFEVVDLNSTLAKAIVFGFIALFMESVLVWSVFRARKTNREIGLQPAPLFEIKAFLLTLSAYLAVGAVGYYLPKEKHPTGERAGDFSSVNNRLAEMESKLENEKK